MENNAQKRKQAPLNVEQVTFSGKSLPDTDAPEQVTFSGKSLPDTDTPEKVDLPDKQALSEQDTLEPSLALDQQEQGPDDAQSLALSDQRTLRRPLSSDTAAALLTLRSVLAQPPIPKLPQTQSGRARSRRRLPVALIALSAALAAIVLLVVFLLPASNTAQHPGGIANAPATTTTGRPTPPPRATTPPGKATQPPTANNPTQPPTTNGTGGNTGAAPPPATGTNPTPIPVTPVPVANSGVLTVTPGAVNVNNDCLAENDGFHCTLTVAPVPGRTDLTLWVAHPEKLGPTIILPITSIILPGHQQQVTVILHNCMNGGDIRFTAEDVAAVVPFVC